VGESADIWSCGVILFAMLCGYLPFDDDPSNPDGDNINLLYKYILETELIVPDYVSADATHLLKRMLVPDPKHRAKMFEVFRHPWMKPFKHIIEESREFTVFYSLFDILAKSIRRGCEWKGR
jgi:serine/threonine protein kinase